MASFQNATLEHLKKLDAQLALVRAAQDEGTKSLKNLTSRLDKELAEVRACTPNCTTPEPTPTPTTPTPQHTCPDGWSRVRDHCYVVSDQKASWDDAQTACAGLTPGGHLASVHADTLSDVNAIIATGGLYTWLGLERTSDGGWAWSDGSGLDITNWASGLPYQRGGRSSSTANCVSSDTSGKWGDARCSASLHFLCQVEAA